MSGVKEFYDCAECRTLHQVLYIKAYNEKKAKAYVVCKETAPLDLKLIVNPQGVGHVPSYLNSPTTKSSR